MEATMTHSQGSTCRQEKELPSKSARKETTSIINDVEECDSLQERSTKKKKTRQFTSIPIDTFLQLNNEFNGEEQLDENEGDNIKEQEKDYINPTKAEEIDNTLKDNCEKNMRIYTAKFIILIQGKKMVLARVNDNWRRYKTTIKQTHFLPYKCINEILKNRPKSILGSHFRKLIKMSTQNKKNRAQQKFVHRKGPINFARIRTRLATFKENNESPTQAEIFIETRQSTKGKSLDEDNLDVHLQAENKKSKESAIRAFQSIFGKEKAGRKNEEIATLKQQHAAEKETLEGKIMLQQKSLGVDLEMLAAQLGSTSGNPNNDANEDEIHVEGEIELN
ncbi:hypothetical protein Ahy_B02g059848 [Arachis hypogaea]|uniref:Uncharacterized protein n=1 Tax=Arachis hypogaea TaxID=3818 RepID=A0A445AHB1_ARAHY|nr:hypothetical protein Ahy_B02g059848 [Arachis hypogaea]